MAKPSSVSKFINSLVASFTGSYDEKTISPYLQDVYRPGSSLYSDTERDEMLKLVNRSNNGALDSTVSPQSYFGAVSRKSIQDTLDNERIIQMAPEISLAASVMIPSILAPNDMREGVVQFVCDSELLTPAQKKKVGDTITDFVEKHFSFSAQLPKWIEEAMYRSGAKAFMVMPISELYRKMTDPKNLEQCLSTESFRTFMETSVENNLFGFGDSDANTSKEALSAGLESLHGDIDRMLSSGKKEPRDKARDAFENLARTICSVENLSISDNADSINLPAAKNKVARKKLSDKVRLQYKISEYDTLSSGDDPEKDLRGHGLFMTWPTESIIPIFPPGDPSNHIAYFGILDEFGHPIDAMDDQKNGLFSSGAGNGNQGMNSNQNSLYQLFQSYGFTQNSMYDQMPERQVMESIYQQIVENHLKNRASSAGFADISLGNNAALYRNMFTRFMQQRQTKLLFIPKEFMTYFCFKHSRYGTGVSKLDDLKWILSLRISLLTTRMMSAFKNGIDRRLIEINFDGKYPGNALQHMRTAQREAIDKELVSFSTFPEDTARLIAERSFSVKVSGVPGIPQYSVTKDTDTRGVATPPDTSLSDDIKNMEYLGLEVPPSVMNNLNDAEFSRSVATTNIVFSRKLAVYQMIICRYFTDLIQNFIRYSAILKEEIGKIISQQVDPKKASTRSKPSSQDAKPAEDAGTITDPEKKTNESAERKIALVISSIRMTLPSPTMAPNNAQFETLQKMADAIGSLMDLYVSDDLAGGNPKLATAVSSFRALCKSTLIQNYARRSGITESDFPDLAESYSADQLLKARHIITNLAAALHKQDEAIVKPSVGSGDDNGGMGGDSGGFGDTSAGGDDNTDTFGGDGDTDLTSDASADGTDDTGDTGDTPPTPDDTGAEPTDTTGTGESPDEGPTGKSLV